MGTHILLPGSPKVFILTGQVVTHRCVLLSAHCEPQSKGSSTHYLVDCKPHVASLQTVTQILVKF